eukprot:SAG31_NODE_40683_length_279_cov_1.127778_1_plen_37_part_10
MLDDDATKRMWQYLRILKLGRTTVDTFLHLWAFFILD